MRYAIIGGAMCRLLDDLTWVSDDAEMAHVLNAATRVLRGSYGPAQGNPRDYVFMTICDQFKATMRNQPEPSLSQELVVY